MVSSLNLISEAVHWPLGIGASWTTFVTAKSNANCSYQDHHDNWDSYHKNFDIGRLFAEPWTWIKCKQNWTVGENLWVEILETNIIIILSLDIKNNCHGNKIWLSNCTRTYFQKNLTWLVILDQWMEFRHAWLPHLSLNVFANQFNSSGKQRAQ